jgi:hypothetical protein
MPLTVTARLPAKYCGAAFAAALMLGSFALIADAQSQAPPAGEPPPSASLAPQPPLGPSPGPSLGPSPGPSPDAPQTSSRPGLLDKLGDWLRDSADGMSTGLKDTQQRIQDLNKGTLDTLTSIPVAGFTTGRALCPRSANGAPDCYAATEKLCKDKGYNTGRSLDTESAETCNPRIYLPGYQRKAGDCRLDTFVTRAACQ